MSKHCLGCGSVLQNENPKQKGYVTNFDMTYCERCFRLKHYHEFPTSHQDATTSFEIHGVVYFFIDFFQLSTASIQMFQQISQEKFLVLTKMDLLPKSVSVKKLCERIQKIYDISANIFSVSVKDEKSLRTLLHHMEKFSVCTFMGMANAGKSSILKKLAFLKDGITLPTLVSEMPNTTLDVMKWKLSSLTIYDTPGKTFSSFQKTVSNYKKKIRPITLPMKPGALCEVENLLCFWEEASQNSVTFYGDEALSPRRIYQNFPTKSVELFIPAKSDLVILGVCFFYFKKETKLHLFLHDSVTYEVRPCLFGGNYD